MDEIQEQIIDRVIRQSKIELADNYDWTFNVLRTYLENLAETPGKFPSKFLSKKAQTALIDACAGGFMSGYSSGTDTAILTTDIEYDTDDTLEHAINLVKMELEDTNQTFSPRMEYLTRAYGKHLAACSNFPTKEHEKYFAVKGFADGILKAEEDKKTNFQKQMAQKEPEFIRLREKHRKLIENLVDAIILDETDTDAASIVLFAKNHDNECNISIETLREKMQNVAMDYAKAILEPLTGDNVHGTLKDDMDTLQDVVGAWLRAVELWLPKYNITFPKLPNELLPPFNSSCEQLKLLLNAADIKLKNDEISFGIRYCETIQTESNNCVSYNISLAGAFGSANATNYVRNSDISISPRITKTYIHECDLDGVFNTH